MSEQVKTKKNSSKVLIIVVIAVVIVVALAFVLTADMRSYSKASKLETSGAYSDAIAVYETIPDYKYAQVRIKECNYQIALALEEAGNYTEALSEFEVLGEYSDAAAHVLECKYQLALAFESDGSYNEALAAYIELGDYADVIEHAMECKYQIALSIEADAKYADALNAFEEIASYADSADHILECKYQIALMTMNTGDASTALSLFEEISEYKDTVQNIGKIESIVSTYNLEYERVITEETALNAAIAEGRELTTNGETPLDADAAINVQQLITIAESSITTLPDSPVTVAEYATASIALADISYASATKELIEANDTLRTSIEQYKLVFAPTEEYVIDRLSRVPEVAFCDAATEENDPNGNLNKPGGYTSQVYFSSTYVSSGFLMMPNMDIIGAGTDCGGSIEVYTTVEDAIAREAYLAVFDGTAFSSGSHKVVGTMVVRTSSQLSASDQIEFEAILIDALTTLNPSPVVERVTADEVEASTNAGIIGEENNALVTVKEVGFEVAHGYLHYAVILHNNSEDTLIEYPEIRITARDAEGGILGVETMVFEALYPQQDLIYGSLGCGVNEVPASVEIIFIDPEYYNMSNIDADSYMPLVVQNTKIKKGGYSSTLVGEVYNPYSYDLSSAAVTIIYRDEEGKLLAGETGYCDFIPAGKTAPFEIYISDDLMGASYEVYAMPW